MLTVDKITEIFCLVDDFCKEFDRDKEGHVHPETTAPKFPYQTTPASRQAGWLQPLLGAGVSFVGKFIKLSDQNVLLMIKKNGKYNLMKLFHLYILLNISIQDNVFLKFSLLTNISNSLNPLINTFR